MRLPRWARRLNRRRTALPLLAELTAAPTQRTAPPGMLPVPITAAAAGVELDAAAWKTWRFGDRAWQAEAWRHYDICGPLRFVANWVGKSLSRCRLYVADLDDAGNILGETDRPDIATLASVPFGAGPQRAEAFRLSGVDLFVGGEAYLVGASKASADGRDAWWVVTGRQIKRRGDQITIARSPLHGGGVHQFRPGIDIIERAWTPHPNDAMEPDSPTRSAIPDLRELEVLRKREFAELDSRLAGAGMLCIPDGIDLPRGDQDPPGSAGFIALLQRVMAAAMRNRDTAEAVVPIIVGGDAEAIKQIRHMTFWSELSEQLLPLRKNAIEALSIDLDIPPEVLTGLGSSNHWCTLPDVEIMTRQGWRTYDQLTVGELVLTLNHETGLSEWQSVRKINVWNATDEPMVKIVGKGHSSVTTFNHRWPILSGKPGRTCRSWTTSHDLIVSANEDGPDTRREEYLVLAAPHAETPVEPKHSDALVELVAWYYTEGDSGQRPGRNTPRVIISQSPTVNADHCARIERCLANIFGSPAERFDKGGRYASPESVARNIEARRLRTEHPDMSISEIAQRLGVSGTMIHNYLASEPKLRDSTPRWRIRRDSHLNRYLLNAAAAEVVLQYAPNRVVDLGFIRELTSAQLELFIDISVKADGYRIGGTTPLLYQKDPARNDAFELAAILAGKSVHRKTWTNTGRSAEGQVEKKIDTVTACTVRTTFAPRGRNFSTEQYSGVVWCPTTENGTWLARHNGTVFYTGNSAWQVSEEAINLHIKPVGDQIVAALTHAYLTSALTAMGEDPSRYAYALDTAPLAARPNRSADATTAHDRMLLSDEATRQAGAWSDADAPTPEERLRRLAEKLFQAKPEVVLASEELREILNLPAAPTPSPTSDGGTGDGTPPDPEQDQESPPEQPAPSETQPAPRPVPTDASLLPVARYAARRAMSVAGGRLVPHRQRPDGVLRHSLHLHAAPGGVDDATATRLLAGAWDDLADALEGIDVDPGAVASTLNGLTRACLTKGMPLDERLIDALFADAGPRPVGRRLPCPAR